MLSIIRFLRGYIRVYLTGFSPERFMNLCNNHQIALWDVTPIKDGYEFYMHINGFFACKDFLQKTKTKVVIRRKLGLPFLLYRYRKRKLFFIGLTACFIALFLSTRYIWAFELEGNRQLTEDMFWEFLEQQHISYGMKIDDLNIDHFERELRETYDYITWASVKIEGTKLHITIKENEVTGEIKNYNGETGDLRATVSGTIISMVTRNGVPQKKPGDIVNQDEIIISGIIPIYNDDGTLRDYHGIRADGDIIIESILPYEDALALEYKKKIYTGKTDEIPVLGFGKNELKLGKETEEGTYEVIAVRKAVKLFDNLYLPLIYGHNEYVEYMIQDATYTEEEASQILNDRFLLFCETLEEKGVQIIQKNVKIDYIGESSKMSGQLIIRQTGAALYPIMEYPIIQTLEEQPIE